MATVLQISDTHLRSEPNTPVDQDPDASLLATMEAVADIPADLILLTGDLADDGSLAAVRRLRDVVARLAAPIMAIGGNHDVVDVVRSTFGGETEMEVGAWRVVGVESSIPGEIHGSVDVHELIGRLDGFDDRPTVIAIHHPPRSPSTNPMFQLIGADDMLAAVRSRRHIRAVVSGHLHDTFDRYDGDVRLCGAPSSYYAIEHTGDSYRSTKSGLVGAQVLTLGDDGSFACNRVSRSLGC